MRRVDERFDRRQPFVEPLEITQKDGVGELDVARPQIVVEIDLTGRELVEVGLQEVRLGRIKPLQERLEAALRDFIVDRMLGKVIAFDQRGDHQRDLAIAGFRSGTQIGRPCGPETGYSPRHPQSTQANHAEQ